MKQSLKRKDGEPIALWILRAARNSGMTQGQTELLISVYRESYDEAMLIGQECERIYQQENTKNNERE